MFKKASNNLLGLVFAVLLLIVVILSFFDSGKNERTFREVLVAIDTSVVTQILIFSKANNYQPIKIFKKNNKWLVELKNGKTASVTEQKITQTFSELSSIIPKRLAARNKEKWGEFQVDSTGTRVQILEGNNRTLDIVIGRFNYKQQARSMSTFVRLYKDVDVYEVDGFLALTFNKDADAFRDGTVIKDDSNSWTQLQFDYPADSSFTLNKINSKWYLNNIETDSAKTAAYLRKLSNLSQNKFVDDDVIQTGQKSMYKLTIRNDKLEFIELFAYVDSTNYVITSSENPEANFDGESFGSTVFVSKKSFLK
ncbi:MAG: DUF4340 domain-containing protein [Cyclobacteriaceae bacterium]|nr:DUF4340 domain-containing protein [Cyclobacteriaceae bacterium]